MRHRYEAVPIFAPDPNLLDGALFGRGRVRRIYEANKGRWRSPEAADLPSRDAPPQTTLYAYAHPCAEYKPARRAIRVAAALFTVR